MVVVVVDDIVGVGVGIDVSVPVLVRRGGGAGGACNVRPYRGSSPYRGGPLGCCWGWSCCGLGLGRTGNSSVEGFRFNCTLATEFLPLDTGLLFCVGREAFADSRPGSNDGVEPTRRGGGGAGLRRIGVCVCVGKLFPSEPAGTEFVVAVRKIVGLVGFAGGRRPLTTSAGLLGSSGSSRRSTNSAFSGFCAGTGGSRGFRGGSGGRFSNADEEAETSLVLWVWKGGGNTGRFSIADEEVETSLAL